MTVSISGTSGITFPDGSLQTAAASPLVLRNRIINGDMRIDQRNAGASITPTDTQYSVDRWACSLSQTSKYTVQQNAGSVTPPAGFTNYLGVTSSSAYSITSTDYFAITQYIEGYNISDLEFGSASAKTITISFWVRSSLTGTFGGAIRNSAANRIYPFSYAISAANTWEQKSVTIAGDTTGTWLTTNGIGIAVWFGLGVGSTYSDTAGAWTTKASTISATGATSVVGTNGATFYITGVQLEQNTSATPFERRLYNQELANCQRYYYKIKSEATGNVFGSAWVSTTTVLYVITQFPVTMRIAATALEQSGTAGDYAAYHGATATTCNVVPAFTGSGLNSTQYAFTSFGVASGLTVGQGGYGRAVNTNAYLGWSAEL
jgi:hypothetical protein